MNVWLVFGLALRIGRRLWPAIFVAAVWAVHPLSTEAVTNIVGRADLLAAFGVLAAFSAHLEARDARGTRRWSWMAASLAAMTIAVFSKESAVAGVGIIVLYDVLWRGEAVSNRGHGAGLDHHRAAGRGVSLSACCGARRFIC